jgi:hypothetical protein
MSHSGTGNGDRTHIAQHGPGRSEGADIKGVVVGGVLVNVEVEVQVKACNVAATGGKALCPVIRPEIRASLRLLLVYNWGFSHRRFGLTPGCQAGQ